MRSNELKAFALMKMVVFLEGIGDAPQGWSLVKSVRNVMENTLAMIAFTTIEDVSMS